MVLRASFNFPNVICMFWINQLEWLLLKVWNQYLYFCLETHLLVIAYQNRQLQLILGCCLNLSKKFWVVVCIDLCQEFFNFHVVCCSLILFCLSCFIMSCFYDLRESWNLILTRGAGQQQPDKITKGMPVISLWLYGWVQTKLMFSLIHAVPNAN